ncbi:MAG TPA: transcription termination/antitermination NusG family protein [Tepidisphaeraceae bacterium]
MGSAVLSREEGTHWLFGDEVPADCQWHLLHTSSRQEKILAETCAAMGVCHFLPLVRKTRYYGKRKATIEVPLFPSYLFLLAPAEDVFQADRTGRVAQIIPVPDQQQLDHELRNLYLALSNSAELDPFPMLKRGVRVEVRSGPFRGLQGVIEDRSRADRLYLKVDMLGTAARMQIDAALLDPLE